MDIFLAEPITKNNSRASPTPSFSKLSSIHTISQSEQMLHLIEPQISSSFRQSFIPIYQRSINQNVGHRRSSNVQCKFSPSSSRRVSSVLSQHQRDSDSSQKSITILRDIKNRLSLPAVYKPYRQSIVTIN